MRRYRTYFLFTLCTVFLLSMLGGTVVLAAPKTGSQAKKSSTRAKPSRVRKRRRRRRRRRYRRRRRRKKVKAQPSKWKQYWSDVRKVWSSVVVFLGKVFYKRPSFKAWLLLLLLFLGLIGAGHALDAWVSSRQGLEKVQQLTKQGKPWDKPDLPYWVQNRFVELAGYWSQNDDLSSIPLVHPDFQDLYLEDLREYKSKDLYNRTTNIRIRQVEILAVHHKPEREEWAFLARIEGTMNSGLYDKKNHLLKSLGTEPKSTERNIGELYFFQYHMGRWKLAGIISTMMREGFKTHRFYEYFEKKPWLARLTKASRRNLLAQKLVQVSTWLLAPTLTWLAYHLFA